MKKFYKYLIIIILVFSSFGLKAQNEGIVFSLMPQIPYGNYYNPGIRTPYNGMFGIAVSNFNFSLYNSSIKASNIFKDGSNNTVIDGLEFVNSLQEHDNYLSANFSLDLLNVGFRVKKLFFNIDYRMRMTSEFRYSKDFVGFFILGNGNYLGEDNPCNFNIGADVMAFTELGVAAQYDVNEHLTVGVRPKLLMGAVNVSVDNENTKIITDPDTYAISADVDLNIKMASALGANIYRIGDIGKVFDSIGNGVGIVNNIGFGVDFGASYVFNKHFGVSAGVYDLGFIKWKDAKVKKNAKEGVSVNNSLFDDLDDLTSMNLDYNTMIKNLVNEVWGNDSLQSGGDYKTSLKTRIMLQGYYELHPMLRFTVIGQMYAVKGQLKPAFTISYSGEFFRFLNISTGYTVSKYTGRSLGIGLGFHAGPLNAYVVAENVLAMSKINSTAIEFATAYQSAGMRLGLVWTIGKYQRVRDRFNN